jgi:hypothetical protein
VQVYTSLKKIVVAGDYLDGSCWERRLACEARDKEERVARKSQVDQLMSAQITVYIVSRRGLPMTAGTFPQEKTMAIKDIKKKWEEKHERSASRASMDE